MKITKVKDHPIIRATSETIRDYISKCDPHDPDKDPKATKKESYAIETFLSLTNVVACIDQLHFSVDMLSGYRNQNTPKRMNRTDYIIYGIENYYLRLTSVYDRCLRLTNVVFQLGLPERECRNSTIIKNSYIKETPVADALKELDRFTNPFRPYRNNIAHESTYTEDEINKLGSYYYIADNDPEFEKYYNFYKIKTDKYVSEKKNEFRGHIDILELLVNTFFDSIQDVLEVQLKIYV